MLKPLHRGTKKYPRNEGKLRIILGPIMAYFPTDLHPSIIGGNAFQDSVRLGKVGSASLE